MNSFEQSFKILKARQHELTDRLSRIRNDRNRVEQPLSADFSEQAVECENNEVLDRLDIATEKDLRQTHHALQRLEAGNYGVCEKCGELIELERLHAVPQATSCTACANALEN